MQGCGPGGDCSSCYAFKFRKVQGPGSGGTARAADRDVDSDHDGASRFLSLIVFRMNSDWV